MKKADAAIGAALMYFGIYMWWQIAVSMTATVSVSLAVAALMWGRAANAIAEVRADSFEAVLDTVLEISLEATESTAVWLLEHAVHLTVVAGVFTLLTYVLIFLLRKKNVFREICLAKMPVLPCFGMIFLGAALNLSVSFILPLIPFPESWWNAQMMQSELIFDVAPWLTFLMTVIVAPILEETVFRGLLYTRLKRAIPPFAAMIISAAVFGAVHGTVIAFIYASLLGFLLAWVLEKYRSLLASMLLHCGFNAFALVCDELGDVPPAVCILSTIISALGIVAVHIASKRSYESK